jgi:hypothetical protein
VLGVTIEMHLLDVKGIDQGPVIIEIVDYPGATVRQGTTNVVGPEDLNVRVPRFREAGIYFVPHFCSDCLQLYRDVPKQIYFTSQLTATIGL